MDDLRISSKLNKLFSKIQAIDKNSGIACNLTVSQMKIMMFIALRLSEGKMVFQKDIEHEFDLKGSSVTSLLNNLEKNNWIRRESVKYDARLKSIVFSEQSHYIIEYLDNVYNDFDECVKNILTETELKTFCGCLDKIDASIDVNRDMIKKGFDKMNEFYKKSILRTDE